MGLKRKAKIKILCNAAPYIGCKGSLFADRNNDDFRQDSTIHNHQRGFNNATPANPMLAQEAINSKLSNALSRSITFPYIPPSKISYDILTSTKQPKMSQIF